MFSVKKQLFSFYFQSLLGITVSYSTLAANVPISSIDRPVPEKMVQVAEPKQQQKAPADFPHTGFQYVYDEKLLAQDFSATEQLLNLAINSGQLNHIEKLLKIYRTFSQQDPILVLFAEAQIAKLQGDYSTAITLYRQIIAQRPDLTPVRIQLAICLFYSQQDNAAQDQFEQALSDQALPQDIASLVNQYLTALKNRQGWKVNLSATYLHTDNVNNASSEHYLENTPFVKNDSMLPQKAHGVGYQFGIERDLNLFNGHYLHLENDLYGRNYWDAHDYDEIINRTLLGYRHKNEKTQWSLLPFNEQQWYGGHRYKRSIGGRGELTHWFTPNWQISTALEYGRNCYAQNDNLDGNSKLASLTLLWRKTPQQYFYAGIDAIRETTNIRHYSYDLTTARLGWGQEWLLGISSRLNVSASKRKYKDNLSLGANFHFDRAREDEIYQINTAVWKRDWHIWGITPKLNYHWKKQRSNFSSLYSYSDKGITLSLEKTF
ncbi:surface lipoprotein assembly modifier [Lonepinella sp. MS14437]|uniref:surface lipoprotein assembly modifier n=1 Tax=unclassified Lonepinella TaxID=2642006 RepID=UPI0036D8B7B7